LAAWQGLVGAAGGLVAVRSSALLEDSLETSAAGQFETFLGVADERDLVTAVRACWASLWSSRALRYLAGRGLDPAATAMAVVVQRLVPARVAGGALSRTPEGGVLITGTWGLGVPVAHGDIVPDRFRLDGAGSLVGIEPGVKDRLVACLGGAGPRPQAVGASRAAEPCLERREAEALGRLVQAAESVLGTPVEVEWALGDEGPQLLQARPLRLGPGPAAEVLDAGLRGQPSGIGRGWGPASVARTEEDLERVGLGDVLVTRVAGPALAAVLPRVAGVVTELGGSTSHLAALARERGVPAVLGVAGATRRVPEGAELTVDGVRGTVCWTRQAPPGAFPERPTEVGREAGG
jgi:pyruvate,water dikinase